MATPLSFTPVLDWVDYTDPTNIPTSIRVITAADLLRYENSHVALTQRVNEHDSLIGNAAGAITTLQNRATEIEALNGTQGTTIASLNGAIANLTSQLNALTRPVLIRSVTTAYTVLPANRIHIHTGGSATYTLPAPGTNVGIEFIFHNKGTGTLTLSSNAGSQIYWGTAAFATYNIPGSNTAYVVSDGTHWVVVINDANASV